MKEMSGIVSVGWWIVSRPMEFGRKYEECQERARQTRGCGKDSPISISVR